MCKLFTKKEMKNVSDKVRERHRVGEVNTAIREARGGREDGCKYSWRGVK